MLVRSKTRYVPTAVNMIVLQGEDGTYYYLHRSLYDQCVVLRDQYINLLPSFYKLFGFEGEHPAVCDRFMREAPEPMDILGPFLSIVTDCEELDNMDDMCGALSSMSMTVDFRKMFKVPASVRSSIKFSLSVREEYRVQWDRFFMETPTFDQVSYSNAHTSVKHQEPEETVAVLDDDGELEEVTFTGGDYSMDDLMSMLDAVPEGEGISSTAGNDDTQEEEQEEDRPKAKSGFSMLRGMK